MSVASQLASVEYVPVAIPERARTPRPSAEAAVITLHAPAAASVAPPLRLTRRGVLALGGLVAVLAGGLVGLAALSVPAAPAVPSAPPAAVTVHSGDTLWSIAGRVAPDADPRTEVADLQRLNRLSGAALRPGQLLRTR